MKVLAVKTAFSSCSLKRHSTDGQRDLHPTSVFFFQFLRDYSFLEYFLTLTGWWNHYSNDLIVHYYLLGSCFDFFFNIDKNNVLSEKEIDQSGFDTIANFSPLPNIIFFKNEVFFYIQNTNINNYTQKLQTYLLQLVK